MPWKENISDAKHRKEVEYEELVNACTEKDWDTEFHDIAVWCRGYGDKKTVKAFRDRIGFSEPNMNQVIKDLQELVEKAYFFIWLKTEDDTLSEK